MQDSTLHLEHGPSSQFPEGHSLLGFLAVAAMMIMAAATVVHAAAPASPQGVITAKGFLNIGGTAVTDLTGNAKFPNSPDGVYYHPYFEWNADASGDINTPANNAYGDNYGAQMIGYFYPPVTGDYIFYLAADDGANLYLSTDDTGANKKLIAQESGWSSARSWETIGGGSTVVAKNSQTFTGTQWATKDPAGGAKITLTANKAYFIEALVKEGGGGDNLAVAVAAPNGSIDQTLPIPGKYLSSFDKKTGPLTIVTPPSNQTASEGKSATFSVVVDGTPPYSYQWRKNGADIPGAISSSYSISLTASADNGAKFSVAVKGAQGNGTSADAVLSVTSDVTPPAIEKVRTTDTFNVARITFTEAVNNAAVTASNYTLSGGLTVSDATFAIVVDDVNNPENPKNPTNPANRLTVVLKTSTQTDGAAYDLTVNANVKDMRGNSVSPNTAKMFANTFKSGLVTHKRWLDQGRNFQTLLADPAAYESPTVTSVLTLVQENDTGFPSSVHMTTISGFFIPATTGDYVFFTSVDNYGWLYLSTDDKPAKQVMVAAEIGWNNAAVWTGPGAATTAGDAANQISSVYRRGVADAANPSGPWVGPFENRSDQFLTSDRSINQNLDNNNKPFVDATAWPTLDASGNAKITLTAGKRYSFTMYRSEPEGGQSGVTFKLASEADPVNGVASRMTGNLIGTLIDPSSLPPVITNQPVSVDFTLGGTVNLSVGVDSAASPSYQWYRGITAVAGATNRTLTISNATSAAVGSYYIAVSTLNGLVNSANAFVYTPATAPQQRVFQQNSAGLLVIEAENFTGSTRAPDGHAWVVNSDRGGFSGTGYVQPLADTGVNLGSTLGFITNGARLDFTVNFTKTGTHYYWFRGGEPRAAGDGDSVHAGIDGTAPPNLVQLTGAPTFTTTGWNWVGANATARASIDVPVAGPHTINAWMREDGFYFDKLIITTDPDYVPTDVGPAESAFTGGAVTPTIRVARSATGGPVITFTGTLQRATSLGTPTSWTDVSGAVSPYAAPSTAPQEYYRARP